MKYTVILVTFDESNRGAIRSGNEIGYIIQLFDILEGNNMEFIWVDFGRRKGEVETA